MQNTFCKSEKVHALKGTTLARIHEINVHAKTLYELCENNECVRVLVSYAPLLMAFSKKLNGRKNRH